MYRTIIFGATLLVAFAARSAFGQFVQIQTVHLLRQPDANAIHIDRTVDEIYVTQEQSSIARFMVYDLSFNYLRDVALLGMPGSSDFSGIVRNPSTEDFYISRFHDGVYRVDLNGIFGVYQDTTFTGPTSSLGFREETQTLLTTDLGFQFVREIALDGSVSNSFNLGDPLGIAYDPVAGTVFITDLFDRVDEYTLNGVHLGTVISSDAHPGNGRGISYDPYSGNLYYTGIGASDQVIVYHDPTRPTLSPVPEPSTYAMLAMASLGGLVYWRRKRRAAT